MSAQLTQVGRAVADGERSSQHLTDLLSEQGAYITGREVLKDGGVTATYLLGEHAQS